MRIIYFCFNSLLEMPVDIKAKYSRSGVVFQFSIGDAVATEHVPGCHASHGFNSLLEMLMEPIAVTPYRKRVKFQFSIGDAYCWRKEDVDLIII